MYRRLLPSSDTSVMEVLNEVLSSDTVSEIVSFDDIHDVVREEIQNGCYGRNTRLPCGIKTNQFCPQTTDPNDAPGIRHHLDNAFGPQVVQGSGHFK